MFVTVDRGFARASFMGEVQGLGMSIICVIPSNLTKCHPFLARSTLNCERKDNIEESENAEKSDSVAVTVRDVLPASFQAQNAVPSPPSCLFAPHEMSKGLHSRGFRRYRTYSVP